MGSGPGMGTPPPRSRLAEAGVPAPLRTSWPGSGASVFPPPPPPPTYRTQFEAAPGADPEPSTPPRLPSHYWKSPPPRERPPARLDHAAWV